MRIAILVASFSIACSLACANIIGNFNFTKTYENSAGPVTFYHTKHAERFLEECAFCHSALETFGGEVTKLFGHEVCRKCHESHRGPTECNQCHKAPHRVTKK